MTGLRQRLRQAWHARHRASERHVLNQRNIYIVPTRAGLAFIVVLLLLLIGSINYQLNLGYALTFLLAGAALASMHITHASLRGLALHHRPVAPCHAGQASALELLISNPGRERHGVGLAVEPESGSAALAWAEIPAQGQSTLILALECPRRGLHPLPLLRIESRFPFGLFRAWSLWRPASQVCVWPAPEHPEPLLPQSGSQQADAGVQRRSEQGEFDGVRPWRRGDSPRRIAWKKLAHSGEWVSRDGSEPQSPPLWLDLADTAGPSVEARLSRLTAWALACERQQRPWGLRAGAHQCAVGSGPAHLDQALRLLAEHRG
ncbi:MAG: DUF58 domain-containing protein [Burkholderiales bacterium]|nr:DUF58 domain-containing protein [Burkholderiales bacterium]